MKGHPDSVVFKSPINFEQIEAKKRYRVDDLVKKALDWHHDTVLHGEKTGRKVGDSFTLFVKEEDCETILRAMEALREKEDREC